MDRLSDHLGFILATKNEQYQELLSTAYFAPIMGHLSLVIVYSVTSMIIPGIRNEKPPAYMHWGFGFGLVLSLALTLSIIKFNSRE